MSDEENCPIMSDPLPHSNMPATTLLTSDNTLTFADFHKFLALLQESEGEAGNVHQADASVKAAESRGKTSDKLIKWIDHTTTSQPILDNNWLIENLFVAGGLGIIYGASTVGKSFLLLDMLLHAAFGLPWRGMCVAQRADSKPLQVVYVSSEGGATGQNRVIAWLREHDMNWPKNFIMTTETFDLRNTNVDADRLADSIEAQLKCCDVLGIDTVSASLGGGDDAEMKDVTAFLARCRRIQARFQCGVIGVHHEGKVAKRGARGHSSLKAAVDLEMHVTRGKGLNTVGKAEVTKLRDGAAGQVFNFRLKQIVIGTNKKNSDVTSAVAMDAIGQFLPLQLRDTQGLECGELNALADINLQPKSSLRQRGKRLGLPHPEGVKRLVERLVAKKLIKRVKGGGLCLTSLGSMLLP